jgi:hypothetical protein
VVVAEPDELVVAGIIFGSGLLIVKRMRPFFMPEKFHRHLELWNMDGTILFDHDVPAYADWQENQQITDANLLKKPFIVRNIADSSGEKDGVMYFRRLVRVSIIHGAAA